MMPVYWQRNHFVMQESGSFTDRFLRMCRVRDRAIGVFSKKFQDGTVDNCSSAGVIGSIPGIIGSIQALEAQKYITGAGELLTGKMLTFDGLTMRFRTVNFGSPSKGCRVCGEHADIHELRPEEYPMPGCSI